jgi:hypothetical protein
LYRLLAKSAEKALDWNGFGHMTVAAVAYDKLTPATKTKVVALLKLNPSYSDWVATMSSPFSDMPNHMIQRSPRSSCTVRRTFIPMAESNIIASYL